MRKKKPAAPQVTFRTAPTAPPTLLMAVKDIQLNPENPRIIKDAKFKQLVKSIQDFPAMLQLRPIIIDEKNIVLGGNMRLKAAKELGLLEVHVVRATGLTKEQKKQFIIKDNLAYGEWDWTMLAAEWDATLLQEWGVDLPEIKAGREAAEDDYDLPEETETDIKLGDLITIGEHRLLCGDATSPEAFSKLMAGDKADIVITDPPYGVSYRGAQVPGAKQWDPIKGDDLRGKDLEELLFASFTNLHAFSQPDIAAYIWYASKTHIQFECAVTAAGFEVKQQLIWNKGMSLGHADYHWAHEPILYCKKKSGTTTWYGDRTEKTILGPKRSDLLSLKKEDLLQIVKNLLDNSTNWEIDKETKTYKHPTQKPVPLAGRAIVNSSKERAIVLDCFAGSGSTMVASHELGRMCYAMDIDPGNCQIIVNRMRKLAPEIEVTRNGQRLD